MMSRDEEDDQGGKGGQSEDSVITTKHAPGRAGIAPMHEFEKAVDDNSLLGHVQRSQDQKLCELVNTKDSEGENGYAPGRIESGHLIYPATPRVISELRFI